MYCSVADAVWRIETSPRKVVTTARVNLDDISDPPLLRVLSIWHPQVRMCSTIYSLTRQFRLCAAIESQGIAVYKYSTLSYNERRSNNLRRAPLPEDIQRLSIVAPSSAYLPGHGAQKLVGADACAAIPRISLPLEV